MEILQAARRRSSLHKEQSYSQVLCRLSRESDSSLSSEQENEKLELSTYSIHSITVPAYASKHDIENHKVYTVYYIEVAAKCGKSWIVEHRYSDFFQLHSDIKEKCPEMFKGGNFSIPHRISLIQVSQSRLARSRRGILEVFLQQAVTMMHNTLNHCCEVLECQAGSAAGQTRQFTEVIQFSSLLLSFLSPQLAVAQGQIQVTSNRRNSFERQNGVSRRIGHGDSKRSSVNTTLRHVARKLKGMNTKSKKGSVENQAKIQRADEKCFTKVDVTKDEDTIKISKDNVFPRIRPRSKSEDELRAKVATLHKALKTQLGEKLVNAVLPSEMTSKQNHGNGDWVHLEELVNKVQKLVYGKNGGFRQSVGKFLTSISWDGKSILERLPEAERSGKVEQFQSVEQSIYFSCDFVGVAHQMLQLATAHEMSMFVENDTLQDKPNHHDKTTVTTQYESDSEYLVKKHNDRQNDTTNNASAVSNNANNVIDSMKVEPSPLNPPAETMAKVSTQSHVAESYPSHVDSGDICSCDSDESDNLETSIKDCILSAIPSPLEQEPDQLTQEELRIMLQQCRDYTMQLSTAIWKSYGQKFVAQSEFQESVVKDVIMQVCERAIIGTLSPQLYYACMMLHSDDAHINETNGTRDVQILTNLAKLRHAIGELSPSLFNAPACAPQLGDNFWGWEPAVQLLNSVNNVGSPSEKLRRVLRCVSEIGNLLNTSLGMETSAGADDFIPIVIYVVACSNLELPAVTLQYMQSLASTQMMESHSVYWLCVLDSALKFCAEFDVSLAVAESQPQEGV